MTENAKDIALFGLLFAASLALALGGMLWLGVDGRVPLDMAADGTVVRSASVMGLWFGPAILLATCALGAPGAVWLSRALAKLRTSEDGEDAARGLRRYRSVLRAYATVFALLTIGLQAFILVRAAGVARPLGLDRESVVRLFFLLAGLLFIAIGNVTPRIPYAPNQIIDAARHHKANRFFGWVFVIGGVIYGVVAVVTPFERLATVGWPICLSMIVLPLIRYAVLIFDYRRELRSGGCKPV
jgi:hypothetical protein